MIELPESLMRYLDDNAVATGVAALSARKVAIPEAVTWSDMDDFYIAYGGAQSMKVEYARFLNRLWDEVWGSQLSTEHRLVAPSATVAELNVTVEDCWSNENFGRGLATLDGHGWLWLTVNLDRDHVGLSAKVEGKQGASLLKCFDRGDGWEVEEGDWVSWSPGSLLPLSHSLEQLGQAAALAIKTLLPLQP